jgi:predicted nucleotidyltransferase
LAAEVLTALRTHYQDLAPRFHIRSLGLFGSVVRDEQTVDSDVDILVEFTTPPTLFGFLELERELAAAIGRRVDLVDRTVLKPGIGKRVLQEVVPV